MSDYPTTRVELLARIAAGRAELDAFVARLSDAQISASGPGGDWSVQDHLYHLGAWERKLLAQMRGESIPAALGIDQATWDRDEIDAINAAIQAQSRDMLLPEALAAYRQAHQEILAALAHYPEAAYASPGYPDWSGSAPMIAYIAGNTYEHYAEHLGYIRAIDDCGLRIAD